MKYYLRLSLVISFMTSFTAYGQDAIDNIIDDNLFFIDHSAVETSQFQQASTHLNQEIDPIDKKSYGAMRPHTWLNNDWALASPQTEKDIFEREISRLQNIPQTYVSAGETLKKGMTSQRVNELSTALYQYGFLTRDQISNQFGDHIFHALKSFQQQSDLSADGVAGAQTIDALSSQGGYKKLVALRWLAHQQKASPHRQGKSVIVNLASQQLRAYENGQLVLTSKVIVGKPATPTPVMSDYIESVTINPTWNVPASIAERTYGGQKVSIVAGPDNPLGKLRIDMNNRERIYLHHTNHPDLFSRSSRLFSAGCVRVEKAYDLAQWLTGYDWNAAAGDQTLRTNREQLIKLKTKVPVYLEYRPVEVLATGKVKYYNDPYHHIRNY